MAEVPVVDVSPLVAGGGARSGAGAPDRRGSATTGREGGDLAAPREVVAEEIARACRDRGFFYVRGHGVPVELQRRLETEARAFFALDEEEKLEIRMERGGRAWRGYFPVGAELTSGRPDLKEGLYFGAELPPGDPRVRAGVPLHGPNLFPSRPVGLGAAVLEYIDALTALGHALMEGIALSLGLPDGYFRAGPTADPLVLFRIFHYPPAEPVEGLIERWGVGEHTDYGVLTILKQDDVGGLQVKSGTGWIDAPPIPDTFVCNIGDMLDRMTRGLYRSTPHRVLNTSGRGRLSFPFFFDPGFDARVEPLPLPDAAAAPDDAAERWDRASVHAFEGTYGDYVLAKVSKVFPELARGG